MQKKAIAKKVVLSVTNPKRGYNSAKFLIEKKKSNKRRELEYKEWFSRYINNLATELHDQRKQSAEFNYRPKISIILPAYNTNLKHLEECIESVRSQTYDNWELCLVDDNSQYNIADYVSTKYKSDRIKTLRLAKNSHISEASNQAIKMSTGLYVALLDHDDLLMPNALFEAVKILNKKSKVDLIYSDEDKIDEKGNHIEPFFKPDWSPDYLYSCNYITHLSILKKSLVEEIGGFRQGAEGAQDWDLLLRFTSQTNQIYHIPKILYSWRKSETSTAKNAKSKPYAYINQLKVLRGSVLNSGKNASVYDTKFSGFWQLKYHIQSMPLVSIIVPNTNSYKLIKKCVESILEISSYPNFELIIIDTKSTDEKVLSFYESKLIKTSNTQILQWKDKFNFSKVCNYGAHNAKGDYLIFLNNDTEIIQNDWIELLLGFASQKEVGMVGCKLLFPNKTIQHAGVVLSKDDIAFHPFYGKNPYVDIFSNVYISNIRNTSAVTAACSMVSRKKFEKVGGFNEELVITYNDVDLCLKLLDKGYKNVYNPYVELYHHESMSVGKINTSDRDNQELIRATEYMKKRWAEYLARDPYYNDNFSLKNGGYTLK